MLQSVYIWLQFMGQAIPSSGKGEATRGNFWADGPSFPVFFADESRARMFLRLQRLEPRGAGKTKGHTKTRAACHFLVRKTRPCTTLIPLPPG